VLRIVNKRVLNMVQNALKQVSKFLELLTAAEMPC